MSSHSDDEIEAAFAKALADMQDLANRIGALPADSEQVWFRNLLFGILNCALHDHHNVRIGLQKYVPLAAWGTRNLLAKRGQTHFGEKGPDAFLG